MRLNHIDLQNYRKFEHVELELPDGILGIMGDNGVGKSTLVESVAWALFGNQRDILRENKESIRRANAPANAKTSARVEFTVSDDEYVVSREMTGKSLSVDASVSVNGKLVARGAKEVTEYIEKRLGMDYKSFFLSIFARQKDLSALSSLTERERKMTIVRMLGIDRLDDAIDSVRRGERVVRERIDGIRAEMHDDAGRLKEEDMERRIRELAEIQEKNALDLSKRRAEQEEIKRASEMLSQRSGAISRRLRELSNIRSKREATKARLDAKRGELTQTKNELKEAIKATSSTELLKKSESEIEQLKRVLESMIDAKTKHEKMTVLRNEIGSGTQMIKELGEEVSKLSSQIDACRTELKRSAELRTAEQDTERQLGELREKQAERRERSKTIEAELDSTERHMEEIDRLGPESLCPTCERPLKEHHTHLREKLQTSVTNLRNSLADVREELKVVERDSTDRANKLEALRKKINSLSKTEKDLAQFEKAVEMNRRQLGDLERDLKGKKTELEGFGEPMFDADGLEKTRADLDRAGMERDSLIRLTALAKREPELKIRVDEIAGEIEDLEKSMEGLSSYPTETELLEANLTEIETEVKENQTRNEEIYEEIYQVTSMSAERNAEIASIEKDRELIRKSRDQLKKLEEELAYSAKLEELMKEFRRHLISRIIPALSKISSELMKELTDGRYCSLTLDDDYNIFVEDNGESYGLSRFSGGEQDIANLCLRLAISRIIAERAGNQGVNLLVLDEIFGSQDTNRKRNLMIAFNALTRQFRQIILITHVEDVKDQLNEIIEVYADEQGISHLRTT